MAATQGKGSNNYHTVGPLQQWQHPTAANFSNLANATTVRESSYSLKVTAASTEVTAAQQIREGCG
jgi:hypothetical protein